MKILLKIGITSLFLLEFEEGGVLVTDLSILYPNTLATINWGWADELWHFFDHWKEHSFWLRLYDKIPRSLPCSWDVPSSRVEYDALIQNIIKNPTPSRWMGA